jgi:uncharacterized membrane protein
MSNDLDKWGVPDGPESIEQKSPAKSFIIADIKISDVLEVLAKGLRDFRQAPSYGLAFGGIYGAGGWLLLSLLLLLDLPFLAYPLAAGFAIIAPFIACAFYCVSDCLERGISLSWGRIFRSLRQAGSQDIAWMALVTGFTLFVWMDIAAFLFFGFFGLSSMSFGDFVNEILTTPKGILFLLIGNTAGAIIALAVFSFSVTSFPMLYHRNVDFITAMITSVRVVRKNPKSMIFWAAMIATMVGLSLLSGFFGFFVVLPVLGHASWHLYRRAVRVREPKDMKSAS